MFLTIKKIPTLLESSRSMFYFVFTCVVINIAAIFPLEGEGSHV
jgi:hypothetical protein